MTQPSKNISYGVGMACSFFEGYLQHVIPGDGGVNLGLTENIHIAEENNSMVFPVKRLFIIITKTRCPPNLVSFNKENSAALGINHLESLMPLQDIKKDVAGVKDRVYRNSVYAIRREGNPPVYVVAECATPLHTLYTVMEKKAVFKELQNADLDEIRDDFCRMLKSIIDSMQQIRGKCELVYFDETDATQNLADVILNKVKEIAPNFETIIAKKTP